MSKYFQNAAHCVKCTCKRALINDGNVQSTVTDVWILWKMWHIAVNNTSLNSMLQRGFKMCMWQRSFKMCILPFFFLKMMLLVFLLRVNKPINIFKWNEGRSREKKIASHSKCCKEANRVYKKNAVIQSSLFLSCWWKLKCFKMFFTKWKYFSFWPFPYFKKLPQFVCVFAC